MMHAKVTLLFSVVIPILFIDHHLLLFEASKLLFVERAGEKLRVSILFLLNLLLELMHQDILLHTSNTIVSILSLS